MPDRTRWSRRFNTARATVGGLAFLKVGRFPTREERLPNWYIRISVRRILSPADQEKGTKQKKSLMEKACEVWRFACFKQRRGRIPDNDFHKSSSEGEGACSRSCAGRSHLYRR
jgi:hypothetical protein